MKILIALTLVLFLAGCADSSRYTSGDGDMQRTAKREGMSGGNTAANTDARVYAMPETGGVVEDNPQPDAAYIIAGAGLILFCGCLAFAARRKH